MEKNNRYQQINWYPGHMFKSFKEIKENLKLMDIIFVLVDARIPFSSMNPEIQKVLGNKPTIILFNKMDLADKSKLKKWIEYYEQKGFTCLEIDAQSGKNVNLLKTTAEEVLKEKIEREQNKGLKQRSIKTMVLGIPNVGKSTLINTLSNRKSTRTGNTPGVTRSKQWVKLANGFDLLDMPGVLWPKFEDETVGYNLAVTGAIKDNILPLDDVTHHAIQFLQTNYLSRLKERYSDEITENSEYVEVLDIIGKKRGALISRGDIDYDRVYMIVLNDLRTKQLGELTFDLL
ncbi:ribosome biogenesis GTPase YlqF [Haploplasma axanthum]|uniref:ribosome biogenesis GTPase YlqF n=1 Tax=Haploplasma axanthum TaxID=29552 RepID=UPI0003F92BD0|nr:ribosome biogenesis GTPase YlqF [Haploplasma axanthum]